MTDLPTPAPIVVKVINEVTRVVKIPGRQGPPGAGFGVNVTGAPYFVTADGTDQRAKIQAAIDSGANVLYFPGADQPYIVNGQLNLVSNQTWLGDGMYASVLSLPQEDLTPNFRGYVAPDEGLQNATFRDMGFRGNVHAQTTLDGNGQFMWGFWIRSGAISNLLWERCHIFEWGEQAETIGNAGGGAGAFGGGGTDGMMDGVQFLNCRIGDNGNVPGLYFDPGALADGDACTNLTVIGNTFYTSEGFLWSVQNMIYFSINSPTQRFENIRIASNFFDLGAPFDTSIEINRSNNIAITGNVWDLHGTAQCEGILLRSDINNVSITGNVMKNNVTGTLRNAITCVDFETGDVQQNISISGNTIVDWGKELVSLSSVTKNVSVSGNVFIGILLTPGVAITVANSESTVVGNNYFRNISVPINFGGSIGTHKVLIGHNVFEDCGQEGASLISTATPFVPGTNIVASSNVVLSPKSGTRSFWGCAFQEPTGNRIFANNLPPDFDTYNVSYVQFIENVTTPAQTNGQIITEAEYSFDQGPVAMIPYNPDINWNDPDVQKSSYVIGSNLDGTLPNVSPGDYVKGIGFFGAQNGPIPNGISLSGYVEAYGKVRINVQNTTTLDLTVPGGTWYVTVAQRNPSNFGGGQLRVGTQTFIVGGYRVIIGGRISIPYSTP